MRLGPRAADRTASGLSINDKATRLAGQRAALIADIAATPMRPNIPDDLEAKLARLSQEPLALFQFLHARDLPEEERPDAAGPSARIRSKIAAVFVKAPGKPRAAAQSEPAWPSAFRTAATSSPATAAQGRPETLSADSAGPTATPFEPSAADIAQALDEGEFAGVSASVWDTLTHAAPGWLGPNAVAAQVVAASVFATATAFAFTLWMIL